MNLKLLIACALLVAGCHNSFKVECENGKLKSFEVFQDTEDFQLKNVDPARLCAEAK